MDRIIVDGRVIELDEWYAARALQNLENAPEGGVLVAVSSGGQVLVRWIEEKASERIVPAIRLVDAKKRPKGVKPTKKLCPWLFTEVESQFDQVAVEQSTSLETMHAGYNDSLEQRGKRPESFRRWVSKIRKRWVKTVITSGKRTSDLESLVT
jgi:predicted alpha/beta hydrolase family esterase